MNRFFKISLASLIGLPLLLLIALLLLIQFQDANRFKPIIEQQAKNKAGINLSIKGELGWSLFPLGIDINDMQVNDQSDQAFASVNRLLAQVDLLSLLKGSPSIHTVLLDGAQVALLESAQGEANWLNILPPQEPHPLNPNETTQSKEAGEQNKTLSFLLSKLEITGLELVYSSELKNQKLELSPVNISVSNIAPNSDIPAKISFSFKDKVQDLRLKADIQALLSFSSDFSKIAIKELSSKFESSGPFSQAKVVHASIKSKLSVDTQAQEILVEQLSLMFEHLKLESQLSLNDYASSPVVKGSLNVSEFSPLEMASKFNIELPAMASPTSLHAFSLSADFELKNQLLKLSQLRTKLDESSWLGQLVFNTQSQALKLKLEGDTFNLDHYLPPPNSDAQTAPPAKDSSPDKDRLQAQTELLPLDTIRQLDMDIAFTQQSLIAKKLLIEKLNLQLSAKKGLLTLKDLSARSHQGTFVTTALLDARSDSAEWKADNTIRGLNLGSLIQALDIQKAEDTINLSGSLNLNTSLSSKGNSLPSLQANALAQSQFEVLEGELQGLNLKALSCKGLALINRDSLDTANWPSSTAFDQLKGQVTLAKEVVNSRFELSSAGLNMDAEGPIKLATNALDIRMGLRVIGDMGERACRVNEKFKHIPIPVRCNGKFDTPPAKLCKLDSQRLREASKQVAVKEGKRKLEKELDRTLKKHLGDKDELKDAAKSLLKKLF